MNLCNLVSDEINIAVEACYTSRVDGLSSPKLKRVPDRDSNFARRQKVGKGKKHVWICWQVFLQLSWRPYSRSVY